MSNLTSITRGDGMAYNLTYSRHHNLASIGIDGKAEDLVTYGYKNGDGRLKSITYANGHTMKATYNGLGELIAERWYESEAQAADSTATPIAHYKYVYDEAGNIVRSIDISAGKEYDYNYEGGLLKYAAEYNVTFGEYDNVTSRTLVNSITYSYDKDGNLIKKAPSIARQTFYYEHPEEGSPIVKFTASGRTITGQTKTDSFGRKVFDELQLGKGFASRQFLYHAGKVTDEHKDNEKTKSSPVCHLVSQIVFSDGRTISYEYDKEERITRMIDSVDGETEYTYDALGQLLTEKHRAVGVEEYTVVNTMEYDNYGNITKKNGVEYAYDSTWKDLLTKVGNDTITYDAQGNPTAYLGHTLTWEKGRQLKSFDGITYTYSANGIRTSKMVNGVKHEYVLDGTKILYEGWDGYNESLKRHNRFIVPLYDNEDSVCGIIFNAMPYFFLKNLQGDVIAITNRDGEVVARYTYDAWGKVTSITGTITAIAEYNPFRYRSYYYDTETGLYYLQSRYYDPETGRFVNADEAELVTVFPLNAKSIESNLFTYCTNDPTNYSDRYGYKKTRMTTTETLVFGIIGLVVNLLKNGMNFLRIFKCSNAATIEKALISIAFLLPTQLSTELIKYYVKQLASVIVTYSSTLIFELAMLGLNVWKLSIWGFVINALCTIALLYLPKLFDSVNMILYGLKKKHYYWDKKWYGITYYSK